MITRVKYKGKWRNVIGITTDRFGRECYKLQCLDNKLCYQVVWAKDIAITEKGNTEPKTRKPRTHKRLTEQEKQQIILMWESGKYYQKEITEKFRIGVYTLRKVVYENRIRAKTNDM